MVSVEFSGILSDAISLFKPSYLFFVVIAALKLLDWNSRTLFRIDHLFGD